MTYHETDENETCCCCWRFLYVSHVVHNRNGVVLCAFFCAVFLCVFFSRFCFCCVRRSGTTEEVTVENEREIVQARWAVKTRPRFCSARKSRMIAPSSPRLSSTGDAVVVAAAVVVHRERGDNDHVGLLQRAVPLCSTDSRPTLARIKSKIM